MSAAKLTDLDTEAQLFSEIWGWRLRFGDLFSANYAPVAFQYMWKKMVKDPRESYTFGVAYQSVLSNIRWIDLENNDNVSIFLTELQKAMKSENIDSSRLSIRLNVDMYQNDSTKNSFTTGRITGIVNVDWLNSCILRMNGLVSEELFRCVGGEIEHKNFGRVSNELIRIKLPL